MKERLVGAAVIIAIGVWLIPLVLDGPDSDPADDNARLTLPAASEPAPVRTQTIHLDEPEPAIADVRRDPVSVGADSSSTPPSSAPSDAARAPAQADSRTDATSAPDSSASESQRAPATAPAQPDTQSAAAAAAGSEPESEPQAPPSPAATESPPGDASSAAATTAAAGDFLVQLGSFGEAENARRLAERVSTYGYTADISPHRAGGRTMHRVRVGPYETRARAEAVMSALTAHGFVAQVVVADGTGQ